MQASQGSPYALQLIGHNITQYADDTGKITDHRLSLAIDQATKEFINDICKTTIVALSDRDEAFLRSMLAAPTGIRVSEVATTMGVSADYAQQYKRRLIDAGIIQQPRRGEVAFAIPYLAEYLEAQS